MEARPLSLGSALCLVIPTKFTPPSEWDTPQRKYMDVIGFMVRISKGNTLRSSYNPSYVWPLPLGIDDHFMSIYRQCLFV